MTTESKSNWSLGLAVTAFVGVLVLGGIAVYGYFKAKSDAAAATGN